MQQLPRLLPVADRVAGTTERSAVAGAGGTCTPELPALGAACCVACARLSLLARVAAHARCVVHHDEGEGEREREERAVEAVLQRNCGCEADDEGGVGRRHPPAIELRTDIRSNAG